MRIAFVHNWFPAGGAERVTMDIAGYLNSVGGYEVFVYATHISQTGLAGEVADMLTVRMIPSQAFPSRRSRVIEKLIVEDGIDIIVQVTKSIPGIEGIRRRTGCKTVVACHGEPFWQRHVIVNRRQKGFLRRVVWHLFNRKRFEDGSLAMKMAVERSRRDYDSCDAYTVLCSSYKYETAAVFGIDPELSHIYAIENPEKTVANPSLDKERIILFCGRMENWSKRTDRLLRIWHSVQDRLQDWKLVIAGDGPDLDKMKRMAGELGLSRVSFEGRQNDMSPYYRKASVVCLTSQTEGWPLALTEAQAHGCICVAFGCTSGVRDILSPEEECGFVIEPFDEGQYADTLIRIAGMSEEEQMHVRKQAIARRAEYVPSVIAQKWKALFDSLMN